MATKAVRTKNLKKPRNLRVKNRKAVTNKDTFTTDLKVGDTVLVLLGGNSKKDRSYKGKIGKIVRFIPKRHRVVVEGVAMIKRHKKASSSQERSGVIEKEGSIHISNVMFYSEELKRPVRIKKLKLESGKKVRAFMNPKTKKLQAIEA
jgi:large subunit ribosomal protein L24